MRKRGQRKDNARERKDCRKRTGERGANMREDLCVIEHNHTLYGRYKEMG